MYRYRDNYLETQQSARPWIRWAAVVLYFLLVGYLTIIWTIQGAAIPNASQAIGGSVTLPEDTYALVVLFNPNKKDLLFNATGLVNQVFAVKTDGSIVPVDNEIESAPRPPAWFLPTTAGVIYLREEGVVTTHRLFSIKNGVGVSVPGQKVLQIPIHPEATIGLRCSTDCPTPGMHLILPGDVDLLSVHGQLIVATEANHKEPFMQFIQESGKQQNPEEQHRITSDGRTVSELVPASTIDTALFDESLQIYFTGGKAFGWYYKKEPISGLLVAANSVDLLTEYISELSTATWTNTVCGKQPVVFYKSISLPMLAEDAPSTLSLVRSSNSWRLCSE